MRYYISTWYDPPALLRCDDDSFANGEVWRRRTWQPTKDIVDYMYGHDDRIDLISETKARQTAPAAFP